MAANPVVAYDDADAPGADTATGTAPGGTGKTYTASRVMLELLREGRSIAVLANSPLGACIRLVDIVVAVHQRGDL